MWVLVSHSQQHHVISCPFLGALSDCPFCHFSPLPFLLVSLLLPIRESFILLRGHVIRSGLSIWMDNPVIFHILMSITLIISAKFLIPCKVAYSQVPRIQHLWDACILPTTYCNTNARLFY